MTHYRAELDSLHSHAVPAWFRDAKLGIFVHWYPAAVPAFAPLTPSPFELAAQHGWPYAMANSPYVEWYQNSLAIEGSPVAVHHARHWPGVSYDQFVATFVAAVEGWDPRIWADLFEWSGARYVVFGTKHHDGVTLWPSRTPNPFKGPGWSVRRDCVGEMAQASRSRGLRYGLYYSGGLDWTFGGLPIDSIPAMLRAVPQSPEYCAYVDGHWRELIERYGPDVLWNDIAYPVGADGPRLFADFYNGHPDGVINDRFDFVGVRAGTAHADFVTPEYAAEEEIRLDMWESCRGIGHSFGYNAWETDADYLAPDELVASFVDIVAKGGNLLLNVGPTARGEIPAAQAARLTALGWWMHTNGAAIHGTRPWRRATGTTAEGLPVRFTAKGDDVYAIVLGRPAGPVVELDVRPAPGASVHLLGHSVPLSWEPVDAGCRITLPERPSAGPGLALRVSAGGSPAVTPPR